MKKLALTLFAVVALAMVIAPIFKGDIAERSCISRDAEGNCTAWIDE